MSFEPIVCPVCTATGNIEQVEPDIYYCPYHKGQFRDVDQRRITVRHERSFCSCGNLVEFQCPLCKKVLCGECDAIESNNRRGSQKNYSYRNRLEDHQTLNQLIVPTRGFGYMETVHSTQLFSVVDGRIKPVQLNRFVIGPFLHMGDILPQLTKRFGELRHICCNCLNAGVPATVEAIARGKICEHPGCGDTPAARCPCCRIPFCNIHILKASTVNFGGNRQIKSGDRSFHPPHLIGLCTMCADERVMAAQEKVDWLERKHPITRITVGLDRKIREVCVEIDRNPGACQRDQAFARQIAILEKKDPRYWATRARAYVSPSSRNPMFATYTILDERGIVPAGPA